MNYHAERRAALLDATTRAQAEAAPLAIRAIRSTLRAVTTRALAEIVSHESAEQERLFKTRDFGEGVEAAKHRRSPNFVGE